RGRSLRATSLLAMPNFGAHPAFLASDFAPSLAFVSSCHDSPPKLDYRFSSLNQGVHSRTRGVVEQGQRAGVLISRAFHGLVFLACAALNRNRDAGFYVQMLFRERDGSKGELS